MRPRELRRLPEAEAVRHWAELYAAGEQPEYSLGLGAAQYLGRDDTWIEAEIPHALYEADWNIAGAELAPRKLALATAYARRPGRLPPGMASFEGRDVAKVCVIDGNHRALASYLRGDLFAIFYLPACDWELFLAALVVLQPDG